MYISNKLLYLLSTQGMIPNCSEQYRALIFYHVLACSIPRILSFLEIITLGYLLCRSFIRKYSISYTRQQKKCPVVQISGTSKVLGRFLSIMYQIKQLIMWVHLISFYDSIFGIDDSANSWKWTKRNSELQTAKYAFSWMFELSS